MSKEWINDSNRLSLGVSHRGVSLMLGEKRRLGVHASPYLHLDEAEPRDTRAKESV